MEKQKKIALINDLTGFGRCSTAVMAPIVSALRIQAVAVPTAILSAHTQFPTYYFDDYTDRMKDYIQTYKDLKLDFDAISTGFLGSEQQVDIVLDFIRHFKTDRNFVIVDPVMGDYGKLYRTYTKEMCEKMKELVHYADIITPNLTELCTLIDAPYPENGASIEELKEMCGKLAERGPKHIVVTGIHFNQTQIANFIYNKGEDFQIVYSDTPGILKPSYKLQESMMKFVTGALTDADVILYVTDTVEQSERSAEIVDSIRRSGIPTVVVINKIDLSTPEALEALVDKWQAEIPGAQVVPTSAKENFNIEGLFRTILSLLPEGPAFYPKDTLTDKTLRFFASEIIREKILKFYDKEIPYCCEIEIESYKEEPTIDRIAATIYVARDSQKGILIGHKGEKLKRVGQTAREDMEQFLGKKVFLQLFVKVSDDWRNNERQLRRFGYEQE
mgnify:FL=1